MSGNSGRDTAGRFASGNPGKRRGARNRATMAALSLMEGQSEALSCKAVQMALGGDTTALRLCLERLVPPVRDAPIQFDLPAMQCARDASDAAAGVLRAVAEGDLTPTEGAKVMALVDVYRRTLETTEFEARLAALEAHPKMYQVD